jgi:hypothetical protein
MSTQVDVVFLSWRAPYHILQQCIDNGDVGTYTEDEIVVNLNDMMASPEHWELVTVTGDPSEEMRQFHILARNRGKK